MHPLDREYFRRFTQDARAGGRSLSDHYLAIQRDHTGSDPSIRPQQELGLRLALAHIRPQDRCLLMGCGGGGEVHWFQAHGVGHLTGLDISPQHLAYCRQTYGIQTVQADMRRTGLPPCAFDVVIARQSIHHLFYPFEALEEFARIARRRVILISEPMRTALKQSLARLRRRRTISGANIYEYNFAPDDVHRYMAFNGFELRACARHVEAVQLPPWANRVLNLLPGLANRFTAVYERMEPVAQASSAESDRP
jgi:SAM-dependent methyltransferase